MEASRKQNGSGRTVAGQNLVGLIQEVGLDLKDIEINCVNYKGKPISDRAVRGWLSGKLTPHKDQITTNAMNLAKAASRIRPGHDIPDLTSRFAQALQLLRQENFTASDPFTGPGPWDALPVATTLAELRNVVFESDLYLRGQSTVDSLNQVARSVIHCTPKTLDPTEGIEHVPYILETVSQWSAFTGAGLSDQDRFVAKNNLIRCRMALASSLGTHASDEDRLILGSFVQGPSPAGITVDQKAPSSQVTADNKPTPLSFVPRMAASAFLRLGLKPGEVIESFQDTDSAIAHLLRESIHVKEKDPEWSATLDQAAREWWLLAYPGEQADRNAMVNMFEGKDWRGSPSLVKHYDDALAEFGLKRSQFAQAHHTDPEGFRREAIRQREFAERAHLIILDRENARLSDLEESLRYEPGVGWGA